MKRKYNLTPSQKSLASELVRLAKTNVIDESFEAWEVSDTDGGSHLDVSKTYSGGEGLREIPGNDGQLKALVKAELLIHGSDQGSYTLLGSIYEAVDSNFAEPEEPLPVSTLAHAVPPELNLSLDRLRRKYPDPSKTGFLIMRFTQGKPFDDIVKAIQETGDALGLSILRADQNEFHADLWGNVRTHLEACSFGIVVYERIKQEEPNANVGLEVGYLLAQNKPVLLLKDETVTTLQADLMGKLYKQFNTHNPQGTIPDQLKAWLKDYGIVL